MDNQGGNPFPFQREREDYKREKGKTRGRVVNMSYRRLAPRRRPTLANEPSSLGLICQTSTRAQCVCVPYCENQCFVCAVALRPRHRPCRLGRPSLRARRFDGRRHGHEGQAHVCGAGALLTISTPQPSSPRPSSARAPAPSSARRRRRCRRPA